MQITRRRFVGLSAVAAATLLLGCNDSAQTAQPIGQAVQSGDAAAAQVPGPLALDASAWNYDAEHNVYWQIGLPYCTSPDAQELERLAVFVPGVFFTATDNGDSTFTCAISDGSLSGFTANNAPTIMTIDTPEFAAQEPLARYDYRNAAKFLEAGFVYVHVGCRGRENGYDDDGNLVYDGGAPWAVADLKAAVRYLRYNDTLIPGNADAIFAFGEGDGGGLASVLGTSGNDIQYLPYLQEIGAALANADGDSLRDNIYGVACWNPNTCLGQADAAYEWMMGQYADDGTRAEGTWTQALSQKLAERYAQFVNDAGLTGSDGEKLSLRSSKEGVYARGSYCDYLLGIIEESLGNFLSDTSFPYSHGESQERGDALEGGLIDSVIGQSKSVADGSADSSGSQEETFKTPQDYIDWLNGDEKWVAYDSKTKSVTVSSVGAFVRHRKAAAKDVCAFDMLDRSSAENMLFGDGGHDVLHFDAWASEILSENAADFAQLEGWDEEVASSFAGDLELEDSMGATVTQRVELYDPLHFLRRAESGQGSVAAHWRIHSGIEQVDTALTTEMNLALALGAVSNVHDVEFITVWEQGRTAAERAGDATDNAIAWVKNIYLG